MPDAAKPKRLTVRLTITLLLLITAAIPIGAAILTTPTVSISPSGGTYTSASRSVTIEWCDDVSLDAGSRQITVLHDGNTTDVTSSFNYQSWSIIDCDVGARSTGTITLGDSLNTLTAKIRDNTGAQGSATANYTYNDPNPPPPVYDVEVTGGGSLTHDAATTGYSTTFSVENTSTNSPGPSTYNLSISACNSPAINCSVSPSSLLINEGSTKTATVTYDVDFLPSPPTGKIEVKATKSGMSSVWDKGHHSLTANPNPNPYTTGFSPPAGTFYDPILPVEIQWCHHTLALDTNSPIESIDRPDGSTDTVTGDFSWSFDPAIDCDPTAGKRSGTITLEEGTNRLRYFVKDTPNGAGTTVLVDYVYVDTLPGTQEAPEVDLSPHNGEYIDTSKCVADCFESVVTFTSPGWRSLDQWRGVTLMYRSGQANPRGLVQANVRTPPGAEDPDHWSLILKDDSGTPVTFTNDLTEMFFEDSTEWSRLAAQFDATAMSSGAYDYTLEVRAWYGGTPESAIDTVRVLIVNEQDSPYGAGWSIPGLQRLQTRANEDDPPAGSLGDVVVVEGDGSIAFFEETSTAGQYARPAGDFSELVYLGNKFERR
ncbi:MAG: hypothetical protein MJB57_18105, partial [Gemmatimonadetes bacterium]|nr:hypothetical protein [Gemmatimonadota bacterium]